jgi:ketosteroid isomerase-like protein
MDLHRAGRPIRVPSWLRLALAALVAGVGPSHLAAQRGTSTSAAAAEREVRESIRAYDDALRRRDVPALERFWAPEYVFVNPGGRVVSREERLAGVRAGPTGFDSLTVGETDVLVYGETAVQRSRVTAAARADGGPTTGEFRALVVWVKDGESWRQVSSQLTMVAVRPSPAAPPDSVRP